MCVEWVSAVLFSGRSAPAGRKGKAKTVRMVFSGLTLLPSRVEWVSAVLFRGKECTCGEGRRAKVVFSDMGTIT